MPIGPYKNFAACKKAQLAKGRSDESAKKICGKLYWQTHGKKEGAKKLKHEVEDIEDLLEKLLKKGKIEWNLSMYLTNRKDDMI